MTACVAPRPTPSAAPAALLAYLAPVVERAGQLCFRIMRDAERLTGDEMARAEYRHHVAASAVLAYVDLGGDCDAPDAFDWDAAREALLSRTMAHLRATIVGKASDFRDVQNRCTPRREVALDPAAQWTQWRVGGEDRRALRRRSLLGGNLRGGDAAADEALAEEALADLPAALAGVLSPTEWTWVVERYRDGVPQTAQIAALVARDPRYQGEGGAARAENRINVAVHRAKRKARERLGARWAALAAEVA
jgi:hypothetical protein